MDRFWSKVDKSGNCWLWTGTKFDDGYGLFNFGGRNHLAHRIAFGPTELFVDHMCHVKHCVNPDHLREATAKVNQENRKGNQKNSTSGYRGVSWAKDRGRWYAHVKHYGKKRNLGYYETKEEAAEVAAKAREELFTPNPLTLGQNT